MKVTFTKESVEREIAELQSRIQFLQTLSRQYLTEVVPVPVAPTTTVAKRRYPNVGVRANLLRLFHSASGALEPETIYAAFSEEQRKVVGNALGTLRLRHFLRETAKGRLELTTAGATEAAWYVAHPNHSKRGHAPANKKSGTVQQ